MAVQMNFQRICLKSGGLPFVKANIAFPTCLRITVVPSAIRFRLTNIDQGDQEDQQKSEKMELHIGDRTSRSDKGISWNRTS